MRRICSLHKQNALDSSELLFEQIKKHVPAYGCPGTGTDAYAWTVRPSALLTTSNGLFKHSDVWSWKSTCQTPVDQLCLTWSGYRLSCVIDLEPPEVVNRWARRHGDFSSASSPSLQLTRARAHKLSSLFQLLSSLSLERCMRTCPHSRVRLWRWNLTT